MKLRLLMAGLAILLIQLKLSVAEDWTRFRGSMGTGVSKQSAPTKWSPEKNVKWKAELPGAGVSCPIIVGDKIFLTCYSGYGIDRRDPGEIEDLQRHVVCVNRNDGSLVWEKKIKAVTPEDRYSGMGVPEHGYASHTPVTDGESLFVFLGKSGVHAFDFEGTELWQAEVGTGSDDRRWGSASSPILFENLVIVPAIAESGALIALDKKTGKEVWKQAADGLRNSWSTPLMVKVDGERSDLVIGVPYEVWGLNPKNGKLRWYFPIDGSSFYTSVSAKDGIVYGSIGGRSGGCSFAVKAGGKGDVTETHKVWMTGDQSSYATPVIHEEKMFIASRGIATLLDAKNGERIIRSRLEKPSANQSESQAERSSGRGRRRGGFGGDYASPVLAEDKFYYIKRNGDMYVMSANKEMETLAVNRVTEDSEEFSATPAIVDGQIFIRSNKHLYCVESTK
ncbi:MAG: PQQ-binding-like beta-propeller repeat protein [Planctomycetota bacterium]